jgi:hypothetical protein
MSPLLVANAQVRMSSLSTLSVADIKLQRFAFCVTDTQAQLFKDVADGNVVVGLIERAVTSVQLIAGSIVAAALTRFVDPYLFICNNVAAD